MADQLTDADRERFAAMLLEQEQEQALCRTAIHEASHAIVYYHLADDVEFSKEDVLLTLYFDAGVCKGNCITPRLPARLKAVQSIAGIVGESVLSMDQSAPVNTIRFFEFCNSDFELCPTDQLDPTLVKDKASLAMHAATILEVNQDAVINLARVLASEGAVGRTLFLAVIQGDE